mgnify:CR=1 FL=1
MGLFDFLRKNKEKYEGELKGNNYFIKFFLSIFFVFLISGCDSMDPADRAIMNCADNYVWNNIYNRKNYGDIIYELKVKHSSIDYDRYDDWKHLTKEQYDKNLRKEEKKYESKLSKIPFSEKLKNPDYSRVATVCEKSRIRAPKIFDSTYKNQSLEIELGHNLDFNRD